MSIILTDNIYIEIFTFLLRKTLLKKGFSSNSFPKTFVIKFQPHRVPITDVRNSKFSLDVYPIGLKSYQKSL